MRRPNRSKRRGFRPRVDHLESRRLLSLMVTSGGQDGVDLVGPDASAGPDGVQDLHLHLSGLAGGAIESIVVAGPSGFEWAYGANPQGAADAEFFASGDGSQGDLYLNPVVRSDLASAGASQGSSTGSTVTLPDGSTLTLSVTYGDGSTASGSVAVSGVATPPAAMPEPAASNVVMNDFAVTSLGQDGTTFPGFVHLRVSGLNGRVITSATLSDGAGFFWSQSDASGQHTLHIGESGNLQTADLYFAPVRNETLAAPGEPAAGMTLRLTFAPDPLGAGTQHVVSFAGGAWNPLLVATPLNGKSVGGVSTQAALAAALATTGAGEVDTISLAPGATIVLTGPLRVTHSVRVVGNGASLVFTQGSAPWSGSATGAIYAAGPGGSDISVDLENLAIRFALSAPLQWYASAGSTTLFDPESSPYGLKAVIDTAQANDARDREALTLVGLTVVGPPNFDAAPAVPPDAYHSYAGEPEIPLVEAGNDDGTIAGSTFQGGSVQVSGGPWTIVGNAHLGALAGSYTPSAFALQDPHDVSLTSNRVAQATAGGATFRLVNLAEQGYDDAIVGNTFLGGQVGNEVTYVKTSAASGFYQGINDSEVILTEPKDFLFEGSPASVSADGRELVLPMASASVASRTFLDASTGPGLIVSILNVSDADGSANPVAGTYYRVAQQVSSSPPTFLMQDPLPAGKYVISVVDGFVGDTIAGNVLNLAGKSSTGIVLSGSDFGTTVASNAIDGGSTYSYPYTGSGILVESGVVSNGESVPGATFPIGYGWSHYPTLGVKVTNNTIADSIGNIVAEVLHGPGIGADDGRRYLSATIANNIVSWQVPYFAAWVAEFLAITNGNGNAANLASDPALPPTVTIGSGFSVNAAQRAPWAAGASPRGFVDPSELAATVTGNAAYLVPLAGTTAQLAEPTGQVYAGTVNGAAYTDYHFNTSVATPAGDAAPYAPLNARNLAVSQTPVGLTAGASEIGIGVDGAAGPANLDAHGNSYSASALGSALDWGGATFGLGAGNTNNVISASGQTIGLPSGRFTRVALLGSSVFGPRAGTFVLTFTDGTTAAYSPTFSDWTGGYAGPGTTAPGESIAAATPYTDDAGGTYRQTAFVYGHALPIPQGKTVRSITLPNDAKIKVLAIDLI